MQDRKGRFSGSACGGTLTRLWNRSSRSATATEPSAASDEAFLDGLQQHAFAYFLQVVNPANGLIADTTPSGSPASIAVMGFALSVYPVGVERGYGTRLTPALKWLSRRWLAW